MGLMDGLLGTSSEIEAGKAIELFKAILSPEEEIQKAYQVVRDTFVFTNKRLILMDKQGVTGKKVEYQSIPYRSIVRFSVESAGHFDLDAELKIWLSGQQEPIKKQFNTRVNVYEVQSVIAYYTCKR